MTDKLKDKIVLVVDDDDRNTFALSSYLETMDMKVAVVSNGIEMLEFLSAGQQVDIILLDMMMPVMNGYETLDAMSQKEEFKKIPVIAVTAKAMTGDQEKCLAAGAWDYIAKPLDLKILSEKLARWL